MLPFCLWDIGTNTDLMHDKEMACRTRPRSTSQIQIFTYLQNIFVCHIRPKHLRFFFDLCLYWVTIVCGNKDDNFWKYQHFWCFFSNHNVELFVHLVIFVYWKILGFSFNIKDLFSTKTILYLAVLCTPQPILSCSSHLHLYAALSSKMTLPFSSLAMLNKL